LARVPSTTRMPQSPSEKFRFSEWGFTAIRLSMMPIEG
jgi:hypothetical protein